MSVETSDYMQLALSGHSFSPKEVIENRKYVAEAGLWPDKVFLLPSDPKARMQMMGNLFVVMMRMLYDAPQPTIPLDDALRKELKNIASSLSYLMNSASFRSGILHDFDRFELDSRLGKRRRF